MTKSEKKSIIQKILASHVFGEDAYYKMLDDTGDLKSNYSDYMTTEPINCDEELKQLPDSDVARYSRCCYEKTTSAMALLKKM